jgi:hypothetical protein
MSGVLQTLEQNVQLLTLLEEQQMNEEHHAHIEGNGQ